MHRLHMIDILAAFAGATALTGWQEQLDWALRIVATLVAIAAGVASLMYHRKVRRTTKAPFDANNR